MSLRFGPSFRSLLYCLSLYSVCSKRLANKIIIYRFLHEMVQNHKRVLGVVYYWSLEIFAPSLKVLIEPNMFKTLQST
ncbi:BBM_1a_G0013620.mRNA.1.CDS.1 [Saccharomyces cerevisiae]|nr:BBM_1a_G0013620.mRNA.1.CDS.1 [Saccharomyces cerevisiae]CAI7086755.1 BBM_1a_G0013620.mRNA.1.CDS.1 [Saccharomyces cerevisiae]